MSVNKNDGISVPGFQYFMTSFLKVLADGSTKHIRAIIGDVIKLEELTPEQCAVKLPSQNDTQVANRIAWVRTYLYKAGLIKQESRGFYSITETGLAALKHPDRIDIKYLKRLAPYQDWITSFSKGKAQEEADQELEDPTTPQERLEAAYNTIMTDVADDLLQKVKQSPPTFFERLVVDVILAMGYGGFAENRGEVTPYVGDGGIDGIIKEDKLGLDKIYVQAKRWENSVPVSAVRDFAGSLLSKKARKGVFITTSYFPQSAYDFVGSIDPTIVLIDGTMLAKLMLEHNVGVSRDRVYEIKKIDSDYFEL